MLCPVMQGVPCCLAFSEGPGQACVVSEGEALTAERRRRFSTVALYADGLVRNLTPPPGLSICLSPSLREKEVDPLGYRLAALG